MNSRTFSASPRIIYLEEQGNNCNTYWANLNETEVINQR